jgi:hypothetical protein
MVTSVLVWLLVRRIPVPDPVRPNRHWRRAAVLASQGKLRIWKGRETVLPVPGERLHNPLVAGGFPFDWQADLAILQLRELGVPCYLQRADGGGQYLGVNVLVPEAYLTDPEWAKIIEGVLRGIR